VIRSIAFFATLIFGFVAACHFGWAGGVIYLAIELVALLLWFHFAPGGTG
jgi:hypothetical protein